MRIDFLAMMLLVFIPEVFQGQRRGFLDSIIPLFEKQNF